MKNFTVKLISMLMEPRSWSAVCDFMWIIRLQPSIKLESTMPLLFTIQSHLLVLLLLWAFASGEFKNYEEPRSEALQSNVRSSPGQTISFTPEQPQGGLPIFPERPDAVYFVVAVAGGAKTWGRTLARTLLDMGAPFSSPQGPPLRPIYVDLPSSGR